MYQLTEAMFYNTHLILFA